MRQLTKQEKELTKAGIEKQRKLLDEAMEVVDYNIKTEKFLKEQREYEDYVRPRKRKEQDAQLNATTEQSKQQIIHSRDIMNELDRQLREGVEVKDEKDK